MLQRIGWRKESKSGFCCALSAEQLEARWMLALASEPEFAWPLDFAPIDLTLGPLDAGQRADAVALGSDGRIALASNDDQGIWRQRRTIDLGLGPAFGCELLRWDADAAPDLIVQTASGLSWARGDGQGNFVVAGTWSTFVSGTMAAPPGMRVGLEHAFLDGDLWSELIAVAPGSNELLIFLGNAAGTLSSPLRVPTGGDTPLVVAAGQILGNPALDLVVGHADGSLRCFEGLGDGNFLLRDEWTQVEPGPLVDVQLADLDGDSRLEVIAATPNDIVVLEPPQATSAATPLRNGDFARGLSDWQTEVVGHPSGGQPGTIRASGNQVRLAEGDSFLVSLQTTFAVTAEMSSLSFDLLACELDLPDQSLPDAFEVSLLDGSGQSLVPTHRSGATSFFNLGPDRHAALGTGVRFDGRTVTVDLSALRPGTTATLYFDLLGNPPGSRSFVTLDNVRTAFATAPSDWLRQSLAGPFNAVRNLATGDVDGDGRLDIVAVDAAANQLLVFNGVGGRTFTRETLELSPRGSGAAVVAAGLLTGGDSITDVAVAMFGSQAVLSPLFADTEFPYVAGTSPDLSNTVLTSSIHQIELLFSEPMYDPGSTSQNSVRNPWAYRLEQVASGTTVDCTNVQYTASTARAMLDFGTLEFEDGDYRLVIEGDDPAGQLLDRFGNPLLGGLDQVLSFRLDAQGPQFDSQTSPAGGEGEAVTVQSVWLDPGGSGPHSATIAWGDGSQSTLPVVFSAGRGVVEAAHIYADNGEYAATTTISDGQQRTSSRSTLVTIANVAPQVVSSLATTGRAGEPLELLVGTISDPGFSSAVAGTLETFQATLDWGDGSPPELVQVTTVNGGPGEATTGEVRGVHTYATAGTYLVSLQVDDDDGGTAHGTVSLEIRRVNLPPQLFLTELVGAEGSRLTLDGTFTADAVEGDFLATIDWGDGSQTTGVIGFAAGAGTVRGTHIYADNGTYPVTVRLVDPLGGAAEAETQAQVANVPPQLNLRGDTTVAASQQTFLELGTFFDPGYSSAAAGTQETFAAQIDWGDGTQSLATIDLGSGHSSSGRILATRAFAAGVYTVSVTLRDDDGGIARGAFQLTVEPPGEVPTKFYVINDNAQRGGYRFDAQGNLLGSFPLAAREPRGAASDRAGHRLWVVDRNNYVYLYNTVDQRLVGGWLAGGLKHPEGVASDGHQLWIVDDFSDRVYLYAAAAARVSGSQAPRSYFNLHRNNRHPTGITVDGDRMWVVDAVDDAVFVYNRNGECLGRWKLDSRNRDPSGITLSPGGGQDLWIVDRQDDKVYHYPLGRTWCSGNHQAAGGFQLPCELRQPEDIADPTLIGVLNQPLESTLLPGEPDLWVFAASAGQQVFLDFQALDLGTLELTFSGPHGTILSGAVSAEQLLDYGPLTLDEGTYVLGIASREGAAATYRLTAWEVSAPDEATTGIGAAAVAGQIESPGSSDRWRFSAAAGAWIDIRGSLPTPGPQLDYQLLAPDGTTLFQGGDSAAKKIRLPQAGTYALLVRFRGDATGPYRVELVETDPPLGLDPTATAGWLALPEEAAAVWSRTTFNRASRTVLAELRIDNRSSQSLTGPLIARIDRLEPLAVTVRNPELHDAQDRPLFAFDTELPHGKLAAGDQSAAVAVELANTSRARFSLDLSLWTPGNRDPQFAAAEPRSASVNQPLVAEVSALDPDGDPVTYALEYGPEGLTLDPHSGQLNWLPGSEQLGRWTVRVRAADNRGGQAFAGFDLQVFPAPLLNQPPLILSDPPTAYALKSSTPGESITLNATVRDLSSNHPDFEKAITGFVPGLVQSQLGPDRKPIFAGPNGRGGITSADSFGQWFHDVPGVNQTTTLPLTLVETAPGSGVYGMLDTDFFPLDDQMLGNEGLPHNYHFTLEIHTQFVYRGGEVFQFTGDDDIWAFVDRSLALDLGGVHSPLSGTLALDTLGLTVGETYDFDFFFVERHTVGSTFQLQTGIALQPGQAYAYSVAAIDPEGDALQFALQQAPAGMAINPDLGTISWNPTSEQIGSHEICAAVRDSAGNVELQTYVLHVSGPGPNHDPQFVSTPLLRVPPAATWRYTARAIDPDFDQVSYALLSGPSEMQLDPETGAAVWTPGPEDLGWQTVSILARDGIGGLSEQTFVVFVGDVPNGLPQFVSTPPVAAVSEQVYRYFARAVDPDGDRLTYSLREAPAGMIVDSTSGVVAWRPTSAQLGSHAVTLQAIDAFGASSEQTFELVVGSGNAPPRIVSLPPQYATVGQPYQYLVVGEDADGDSLFYSLEQAPAAALLSPDGQLTWTPAANQLGWQHIVVRASDSGGMLAWQSFWVEVQPGNTTPQFLSLAPTHTPMGREYRYQPRVVDAEDSLGFSLLQAPATATVDPRTGLVRWQPTAELIGSDVSFLLRATDARGLSSDQAFNVSVDADTTPPQLAIVTDHTLVAVGDEVQIEVRAADDVALAAVSLQINGQPVSLDANYRATWTATAAGLIALQADARDSSGNIQTSTATIRAVDPHDVTPPNVAWSRPAAGAIVTYLTELVGSVAAADLESYWVEYALAGTNDWIQLGGGTTPQAAQVLATFDPTLLANDVYEIRLTAQDTSGNQASSTQTLTVDGGAKLGNYTLSFNDVSLPLAGIPLTLTRRYDTLEAGRQGDFGFGWRMEIAAANIREGLPVSQAELDGVPPLFGGAAGFAVGTRVLITAPDGQRLSYRFEPTPEPGLLGTVWHPRFVADHGSRFQLLVDDVALQQNADGTFGLFLIGGNYNPRAYTLLGSDQLRYEYDQFAGLRTVTDRHGVRLEYRSDGIFSNSGPALRWERDADGRIVRIVLPDGHELAYTYDSRGDLRTFRDAAGNVTSLQYRTDPAHYLERVVGPRGNVLSEVRYDDAGRYVAVVDAAGNAVQQSYDLPDHSYSQTDRLGNVTTLRFDDLGNVLQVIDPLGNATTATYDDPRFPRRETSLTDARGNVTRYRYDPRGNLAEILESDRVTTIVYNERNDMVSLTGPVPLMPPAGYVAPVLELVYDAAGNLVSQTNAAGETTTYSNDAWGRMTAQTDPLGRTTRYVYDGFAHPAEIHFPDGSVRRMERNAMGLFAATTNELGDRVEFLRNEAGQPLGFIDALGNTLRNEFDAALLVRSIDPLGRATELEYDELDRLTRIIDPAGGIVTREYDANHQLVRSTNQAGQTDSWTYDAAGRVTAHTDPAGNVTTYRYDPAGNLLETRNPRGYATQNAYDAHNRLVARTDPLGFVETYTYDAHDRLVSLTDRRGYTTRYEYDSIGRLVRAIDPLGLTRSWAYDGAGNLRTATDARGGITQFEFDDRDQLIRQVDPLGFAQRWEYDPAGRLAEYVDSAGGRSRYRYDANHQLLEFRDPRDSVHVYTYDAAGHQLTATDPLGRTTRWTYDVLDRVVASQDAAGAVTRYAYDPVGNLLELVDPQGNATSWSYDALQRVVARIDPLGRIASFSYDPVGNLVAQTDRAGRITEFRYDPLDRLLGETWRSDSGAVVGGYEYAYDPNGNLLEAGDDAARYAFTFDPLNRVTRVDNAGSNSLPHVVLDYQYDAEGNVTHVADNDGVTVDTQFDLRNLPVVKTWSGPTRNAGRVEFDYDGRGLPLETRRYADAAANTLVSQTLRAFDPLGQITAISHRDGAENELAGYQFAYDAAGQMIRQVIRGVATDYTYDQLGQLTSADSAGGTSDTYTYDAAGNRTGDSRVVGPGNLLLADAAFDYQYDAEGNLVRKTDRASGEFLQLIYDHRNRLRKAERFSAAGELLTSTALEYDVFDRLIARQVDGDGTGPLAAETTRTVYDGQHAWADFDASGQVVARYLFGEQLDQNLARWRPQDGVAWYLTDQLGSVRELLDATGAELDRIDYDSFGGIRAESNPTAGDRFKFTGREWQAELGLYYFRARFYDPGSGRFISQDPLGFAAGDVNLHRYVGNSPLTFVDPTGTSVEGAASFLMSRQFMAIASGVLGSAVGYFCSYLDAWYEAEGSPYQELQAHATAVVGSAVGFSVGVGIGLVTSGVAAGSAAATGLAGFFTGLGTGFNLINIANARNQEIRTVRISCFLAELATGALAGTSRRSVRDFLADESGTLRLKSSSESVAPTRNPRFAYDSKTGRYRDKLTGQFVSVRDLPWPPNSGFENSARQTIQPGTILDRFGKPSGRFLGEPGASISARGMPPGSDMLPYTQYVVLKPFDAQVGPAIGVPSFGASGGAIQYLPDKTVQWLLENMFLKVVK